MFKFFQKKQSRKKIIFFNKTLIVFLLFLGFFSFKINWEKILKEVLLINKTYAGECVNGLDTETSLECEVSSTSNQTSTSSTPPPANIDSTPKPTSFVPKEQTTATLESTLPKETVETLEKVGSLIALGIRYMTMPLLAIISYIGELLSNRFIFGGNESAIQEVLKIIWTLMRDIVNVLFVGILIVLAFMNVVKESGDGWEIKSMLPKIVIALVAVNFSWSACKVLVDFSSVATATVFAIPESIRNNNTLKLAKNAFDCTQWMETTVEITKKNLAGTPYSSNVTYVPNTGYCSPDLMSFLEKHEIVKKNSKGKYQAVKKVDSVDGMLFLLNDINTLEFNDAEGISGVVYGMALGTLDIQGLVYKAGGIKSLLDLSLDTIFSLILFIIYAVVYISMFVVLLARVVVVWLIIAFSPLWALNFVLWDKINLTEKLGGVKIMHEIFMPALIGIPLVIGYVLVLAGQTMTTEIVWSESQLSVLFDSMFGGYQLMWQIMVVVILWKGVFAAMDESVAKSVVEKIKGGAEAVGGFAMRAARYAPIIPVSKDPGGGAQAEKVGVGTLLDGFQMLNQKLTDYKNKQYDTLGESVPVFKSEANTNLRELEGARNDTDIKQAVHKLINSKRTYNDLTKNEMQKIAEKMGDSRVNIKPEHKTALKNAALSGSTAEFKTAMDNTIKKNSDIFGGGVNNADELLSVAPSAVGGDDSKTLDASKGVTQIQNIFNAKIGNHINGSAEGDLQAVTQASLEAIEDVGQGDEVITSYRTKIGEYKTKDGIPDENKKYLTGLESYVKDASNVDELQAFHKAWKAMAESTEAEQTAKKAKLEEFRKLVADNKATADTVKALIS